MEIFQNRQQHEVVAKTSREETTSSSKRGIMYEMLERPAGLAMKKTAENYAMIRKSTDNQNHKSVNVKWTKVSNSFPRLSSEEQLKIRITKRTPPIKGRFQDKFAGLAANPHASRTPSSPDLGGSLLTQCTEETKCLTPSPAPFR
jgi:hypothetical protein